MLKYCNKNDYLIKLYGTKVSKGIKNKKLKRYFLETLLHLYYIHSLAEIILYKQKVKNKTIKIVKQIVLMFLFLLHNFIQFVFAIYKSAKLEENRSKH